MLALLYILRYLTISFASNRSLATLRRRCQAIVMCWFWCFKSKATNRRAADKRNNCTTELRLSPSIFAPLLFTAKSTRKHQLLSHPPPRTPTPRPPQSASESSRPSNLSTSLARVDPLEHPLSTQRSIATPAPTDRSIDTCTLTPIASTRPSNITSTLPPTSRQYYKTYKAHNPISSPFSRANSMPRSRLRYVGPQGRNDSPTFPEDKVRSRLDFQERMARLSTLSPPDHMAKRPNFLDDDSSGSSDGEQEDQTPTRNVANLTTQPDYIPRPLVFSTQVHMPIVEVSAPQTSGPLGDAPLCDHRPCLKHKQTCLKHTSISAAPIRAGKLPAPQSHGTQQRRRSRTRDSQQYVPDVWMQIAAGYPRGS